MGSYECIIAGKPVICRGVIMKKFVSQFLTCGLIGWCLEIVFTALHCLPKNDLTLKGTTSIWMFPIYGMATFLKPICKIIKGKNLLTRGSLYALFIFITEYVSGRFLEKRHMCPWNYKDAKWNIHNVIRLDYAPYWFCTGLLFEKILTGTGKSRR